MSSVDNEMELADFAEYLLRHSLVPERYMVYHVRWVRRFHHRKRRIGHKESQEEEEKKRVHRSQ